MKKIRFLSALLSLLLLVTLFAGCSQATDGCYEFSMGKGLPTWKFNEPRQKVLPDSNSDENLIAIYKTDSTHADVYVYEYEKQGNTIESMAKAEAEVFEVKVTAIKDKGVDAQTYISYERINDTSYINQVYFYEGTEKIVKICVKYKTDTFKLAGTEYTFCLPAGYTAELKTDDVFKYSCEYTTKSEYLPTIIIRKFAKDFFTSKTYDLSNVTGITEEEYDALAKDGWTLEEELEYYKKVHELDRGEIINRNGKRITFIGFFEGDMQKSRAIIDCGNDFVEICVEQKKSEFKHITSAIIDSLAIPEKSEEIVGGWQEPESKEITNELEKIFFAAEPDLSVGGYTPKEFLGTQVVSGTNYKFLCDKKSNDPDGKTSEVIVEIYKDLSGNCTVKSAHFLNK